MVNHNMNHHWSQAQQNPMFFTSWHRSCHDEPLLLAGSGILIRKNHPAAVMVKYTGTLPLGEAPLFDRIGDWHRQSEENTPTLIAGVIGGWKASRDSCYIFIYLAGGETVLVHWDQRTGWRGGPYWELVG